MKEEELGVENHPNDPPKQSKEPKGSRLEELAFHTLAALIAKGLIEIFQYLINTFEQLFTML